MPHYTIFERTTGRIVEAAEYDTTREPLEYATEEKGVLLEASWPSEQYVSRGRVVARPKLCPDKMDIVADGVSEIMFPVPGGTAIHFDGQIVVVDDGKFQFRTSLAKTYRFIVNPPFPYQVREVEIIAHAV